MKSFRWWYLIGWKLQHTKNSKQEEVDLQCRSKYWTIQMHLILMSTPIHFHYNSNLIWRIHRCTFTLNIILHVLIFKTCYWFWKLVILIWKSLSLIFANMSSIIENVLLVFDNLVIDIKKDVIHIQNYVFHFKIMSIIFLNVFFILHNLVIGMHAILIAFFVVVCMRQTSILNLKWTRKYLSEKSMCIWSIMAKS